MGALGFTFISPEAAKAWVHRYYNNLLHHPFCLAEYPANPKIAMVSGFMCAETGEEARENVAGWTFFIFALSRYGRKGIDAPGESDLWAEYQVWRDSDKAKEAVDNALVGSPETIHEKLWQFQKSHVDQVTLLNQAGKTSHKDICESLEMFAKEVMLEFMAEVPAHQAWKQDVLKGTFVLEDLDTQPYDLYSHQNEDIICMSPEELKAMMATKKAEKVAASDD